MILLCIIWNFQGITQTSFLFSNPNAIGQLVSHDVLLGRWRLSLDLFGRVFCDDVGAEPGSVISELGGFPVKETRFRRDMEKLRNSQQRDLALEVHSCSLKIDKISSIYFEKHIISILLHHILISG